MWNETAGNGISADEIRNEKSVFDFRIWEKQKLQTDQKYLWREGRVKPEVARIKARRRSSGVRVVFVHLIFIPNWKLKIKNSQSWFSMFDT